MAKSRKYIKEDDDDNKINAVIVDDGSMDNDTTTTDPGYCPGTGGSCPPPKPEWGTKEHRDMIKKTLNPTKKDKKQKKKRVRKFFLGGLMKAAKKGIKGAAKIGLLGGGAMAASHLLGKKNKGGGDAAEAEGVSSRDLEVFLVQYMVKCHKINRHE